MSDSLISKVVRKTKKIGHSIYDNRREILEAVATVATAAVGGIICCSVGMHYGYLDGYNDGWHMSDAHTKEILEAVNKSHETIIKQ